MEKRHKLLLLAVLCVCFVLDYRSSFNLPSDIREWIAKPVDVFQLVAAKLKVSKPPASLPQQQFSTWNGQHLNGIHLSPFAKWKFLGRDLICCCPLTVSIIHRKPFNFPLVAYLWDCYDRHGRFHNFFIIFHVDEWISMLGYNLNLHSELEQPCWSDS